jgi:hypothetical protein
MRERLGKESNRSVSSGTDFSDRNAEKVAVSIVPGTRNFSTVIALYIESPHLQI